MNRDAILAELLEIEGMRGVAPGRLRSGAQILSTGMMQRAFPVLVDNMDGAIVLSRQSNLHAVI
jgi:hypothetical protein